MLQGGWKINGPKKVFRVDKPIISVITAVFNSHEFFEETILSIISQEYENLEYIVIDGGSSDGTIDIIRKYEDQIAYWISEFDDGISDAFNKGVKLSTGDYINFQGAGDLLDSTIVLKEIFNELKGNPVFISGRIKRVREFNSSEIIYISPDYTKKGFKPSDLLWKMTLPHQGLFTHKNYFEQFGLFNKKFKYSMDYEHLLRSYKQFPSVLFVGIVSRWRADGLGNNKEFEIYKEYNLIKHVNKIEPAPYLWIVHGVILFKYLIKKIILNVSKGITS